MISARDDLTKYIDDRLSKLGQDLERRIERETELAVKEVRGEFTSSVSSEMKNIAFEAIDRSFGIIDKVKHIVIIIVVGFLSAVFAAVWQVYDKTSIYAERRIDAWISVDDGGLIRKKLEELRERSIIDSLILRYSRQNNGGDPFSTSRISLSQEERHRLLVFMRRSDVGDADFIDAAHLISLMRGSFLGYSQDKEMLDVAREVFSSGKYSDDKRYGLLLAWQSESIMIPFSREILNKQEAGLGAWKVLALRNLRLFSPEEAVKAASSEIEKGGYSDVVREGINILASEDPLSPIIPMWVSKWAKSNAEEYPAVLVKIASASARSKAWEKRDKRLIDWTSYLVSEAIDGGSRLSIGETGGSYRDVSIVTKGSNVSYPLENPREFFGLNEVLTKVLSKASGNVTDFHRYVRALQLVDERYSVVSIRADLTNGGEFVFEDGSKISSSDTSEPTLVRASTDLRDNGVDITFVSKNGSYRTKRMRSMNDANKIIFAYEVNDSIIGRLSMRRLGELFSN